MHIGWETDDDITHIIPVHYEQQTCVISKQQYNICIITRT